MQLNVCKYAAMPFLALAVTAAPALAEGLGIIRVTIPFQFIAGKTTFPAGDYRITQGSNSGVLTINGEKGGAMVMTTTGEKISDTKESALSFERSTKGVVLKEVKLSGQNSSVLPVK